MNFYLCVLAFFILGQSLKIVKFKAQENLKPESTTVNEDFKFSQQRRSLHF